MARKVVTPEQVEKALNPQLTDAKAKLCGKEFKVIVMSCDKEQVFIKELRDLIPTADTTVDIVKSLINIDMNKVCELAALVAKNSGEDFTAEEIMKSTRLLDIAKAIEIQITEQGYLDFLLQITAALPGMLTVKP